MIAKINFKINKIRHELIMAEIKGWEHESLMGFFSPLFFHLFKFLHNSAWELLLCTMISFYIDIYVGSFFYSV